MHRQLLMNVDSIEWKDKGRLTQRRQTTSSNGKLKLRESWKALVQATPGPCKLCACIALMPEPCSTPAPAAVASFHRNNRKIPLT